MEIVDRVIKELRPIADKLGEGAEFLWQTLMLQMYVRATVSAIVTLTLLGLYAKYAPRAWVAFSEGKGGPYTIWESKKIAGAWFVFGGGVAAVVSFIILVTYSIPRFINPAYYALHEILRTVT